MMSDKKFANFSRRDFVYSSVNGHDILVTVLTPKTLHEKAPAKYPVLIHWHGGGYITGHRLYGPWWPDWFIELAFTHNALIITPDHRLLPEANGTDILADVEAFSTWLHSSLPSIAATESWHAAPDMDRVAAFGASSGGWLAMQMALLFPAKVKLKALMTVCAPLNNTSGGNNIPKGPRMILGSWPPPPREAEALIRGYMRSAKAGSVRSAGDPADMWPMLLSIAQQAWLPRLLGLKGNPRLDLKKTLSEVEMTSLPPLWISHAEQDSIISVECSTEFAKVVARDFPEVPLLLTVKPGDHMWTEALAMREDWVNEGCRFVSRFWP